VARTLGVTDMVDFLGFVDEKTKHRVYASAWLLALPSLKEGWGIVVMEAATHGVPAVAYRDAGGVRESIQHGRTGVLVDGDVLDYAQALDDLLSDPARVHVMGATAQRRAEEFTWAATAKAFAAVLSDVAGDAAGGKVTVVPAPSGHVEHVPAARTDQVSP